MANPIDLLRRDVDVAKERLKYLEEGNLDLHELCGQAINAAVDADQRVLRLSETMAEMSEAIENGNKLVERLILRLSSLLPQGGAAN